MSSGNFHKNKASAGFTLLEFAVVLIIIGLVLGGVAAGRNFIRSAELKTISADVNHFITVTKQFQDKYHTLPGDMANATAQWGAAHATPATCRTTPSNSQATCDGDGNGILGQRLNRRPVAVSAFSAVDGVAYEKFRYWQQLKNEGFITGAYNGVAGPGGANETVIGINTPHSDVVGSGFSVHYLGDWTGNGGAGDTDSNFWDGKWGHVFFYGGQMAGGATGAPIITATEAEEFDRKMDDGLPSTGKVSTVKTSIVAPNDTEFRNGATQNCITNGNRATARYATNAAFSECMLIFRGGF